MATARVSGKRSYDDFLGSPYGNFGYSAHAGRNVDRVASDVETMDFMDDVLPSTKRPKHDDEAAQSSAPSTQANLIASAVQSLPKYTSSEDVLDPRTWLRALPRNRRKHHELIGTVGCVGKDDSVFSLEDVTNILVAALKAQEERLHMNYQATLGEKLAEQAREHEIEREAENQARYRQDDSYYS